MTQHLVETTAREDERLSAVYLPASESLESLESLLSESDELVLVALSLRVGRPADDGLDVDWSAETQSHIHQSVSEYCDITNADRDPNVC